MRPLYPPRSLRSRPSQREGGLDALDVLDVGKTSDKVSSDRIAKQYLPTKNDQGPQREGDFLFGSLTPQLHACHGLRHGTYSPSIQMTPAARNTANWNHQTQPQNPILDFA